MMPENERYRGRWNGNFDSKKSYDENELVIQVAGMINAQNAREVFEEINALNIFPVPDGDTGTNMSMTIGAAAKALEEVTSQCVSFL